jgi:hypothetical protein
MVDKYKKQIYIYISMVERLKSKLKLTDKQSEAGWKQIRKDIYVKPECVKKHSRHIPVAWKEQIIKRQKGYCANKNCAKLNGKKAKITINCNFDHTKPFAMGGKTTLKNLKGYCPNCHAEKTRKDREKIRKWKEKQKKK